MPVAPDEQRRSCAAPDIQRTHDRLLSREKILQIGKPSRRRNRPSAVSREAHLVLSALEASLSALALILQITLRRSTFSDPIAGENRVDTRNKCTQASVLPPAVLLIDTVRGINLGNKP